MRGLKWIHLWRVPPQKTSGVVAAVVLSIIWAADACAAAFVERPEWGQYFTAAGATGAICVVDERPQGGSFVYDLSRASRRVTPASTFKIAHALFALDAGIVKDEFQVFPWDGVKRSVGIPKYDAVWNGDQALRSSMRYSVVWLYQGFARTLGPEKERQYLQRIQYGNAQIGPEVDQFWLDGSLKISAVEQVEFLRRLYRNNLPFPVQNQWLVKDILVTEAGSDYILRSKTGWGTPKTGAPVGWYVGWVEQDEGAVFFALNMDTPNGASDLPKRQMIVHGILKGMRVSGL